MTKLMRIIVFFDLPVKSKKQRRDATRFRNFLLKDGYHMMQYSVYARVCNGTDSIEVHKKRLRAALPSAGAIRAIVITEKQFESIEILLGSKSECDDPKQGQHLIIF